MITNQIIKNTIDELRGITKTDLCIFDLNGDEVASTYEAEDITPELIVSFSKSAVDSQVIGQNHLLKIMDDEELVYILNARGFGEDAYMIGRIAVSEIQNLIVAYKERFDRNNFFQNLILDNMLLVDIYNRAKKLRIETEYPRVVFLVENDMEKENAAVELLKSLFSEQSGDYVTTVDEKNIILIKSIQEGDDYSTENLDALALTIVDMMNTEIMVNTRVAYGTMVQELKDVSKSYKEAKMAMEVAGIFYADKTIAAYSSLGIGRLIYQLPTNLCRLYIDEIFGDHIPDDMDEESLMTINKFFENNLNISETARQLFIHRNTLVYRIERLQKEYGLDIRIFDEALTFKIALMVVSYMKYIDGREY
ncbi:MAG: helix-turn-helix domain-containing protein [Lachnospiraceae bacterium]|nr:helix-turn-helix domain-containing protein [Lachnospiraceae bacterium]